MKSRKDLIQEALRMEDSDPKERNLSISAVNNPNISLNISLGQECAEAVQRGVIKQEEYDLIDLLLEMLVARRKGAGERAPKKREDIYRQCHGMQKECRTVVQRHLLMKVRWGAGSMRQLNDEQLATLFYYMREMEAHQFFKGR